MEQSHDRKNFALFMIMVAVAMLVYSMYFRPAPPRPGPSDGNGTEQTPGDGTGTGTGTGAPPPVVSAEDIGGDKEPGRQFTVRTPEMEIRLSSAGAAIEKLALRNHHPNAGETQPLVLLDRDLLVPEGTAEPPGAAQAPAGAQARKYARRRSMVVTGLVADGQPAGDFEDWNWKLVGIKLGGKALAGAPEPAEPVEVTPAAGTATVEFAARRGVQEIRKIYTFHGKEDSFDIGVELTFVNHDSGRRQINYKLIGAAGFVLDEPQSRYSAVSAMLAGRDNLYGDVETLTVAPTSAPDYVRDEKTETKLKLSRQIVEWAALRGHYFAAVLCPEQPNGKQMIAAFAEPLDMAEAEKKRMNLAVGLKSSDFLLGSAESRSHRFLFRVGPQQLSMLEGYVYEYTDNSEKKQASRELSASIDFGWSWFAWLSKLLLKLLRLIYVIVPNYGVCIVLLTLVVKLGLHPLSLKGQKSMQRMQELQPKMQAIQKQFKNDPQKLQQAQMRLWKEEGVNPASGCLPMALQMPVFFGLWGAIRGAFVFRQAPFLWIRDLSRPDMVVALDFWPHYLNVLPILYGALMVVQMSMQPIPKEGQARQQAMMMRFMPAVFFFVIYNMASAFVLYFAASAIIGLVESRIIKAQLRKAKEAREAAANGGAASLAAAAAGGEDAPAPDARSFWQAEAEKKLKGKKGKR